MTEFKLTGISENTLSKKSRSSLDLVRGRMMYFPGGTSNLKVFARIGKMSLFLTVKRSSSNASWLSGSFASVALIKAKAKELEVRFRKRTKR